MKKSEPFYEAALQYTSLGWAVFPLHSIDVNNECTCGTPACKDAGKHPRGQRGLKEASKALEDVRRWFGKDAPPSNIGIVTGGISNITVIDIDIGPGKFGDQSWAEAIKDHGEPVTLMANTGGGGIHCFFQYNSALKTASNVLGKGVDCRNDGGYVVAPPSRHRSGGTYSWIDFDVRPGPLPSHLSRRKENRGRPRSNDMYRGKYSVEQVTAMLKLIPADDRDFWRSVGIILGREYGRSQLAWEAYVDWSAKWGGKKGRNHDEIMHESFYTISQETASKELTLGSIVKAAMDNGWAPQSGEVPIGNFVFYGPGNNFIYRPTISYWVAGAVDAAVSPVNENGKIIDASVWLKMNQLCTSLTCDPAIEDDYVKGVDCRDGEIVKVAGAALFNSYRRPTVELGDARMAEPFLHHVRRVFRREGDADQFLDYIAHRVQRPEEKPRFALLIAGGQGVGKDTAVEFCCPAIGPWNVANIDPAAFESNFNEFASATLVRISEAANLHEMSKWAFNERTKVLIAGSPDVVAINPKYGQKFTVRMHCGVIITTNHLATGIYIPPDDRRYDVIEAASLLEMDLENEANRREYFTVLWDWFLSSNGASHVAAFLNERDLSNFSAANGQRKTNAHKVVVAGGLQADNWLDDILDSLGNPQGIRADWIVNKAVAMGEKEGDVKRKISNSLGRLGYVVFRCPTIADGRWKIGGKKVTIYVRNGTPATYRPDIELGQEPF